MEKDAQQFYCEKKACIVSRSLSSLLILSLVVGKVSCTDKKECFQGFVIIINIIILIRSVEFF